MNMSPTRYAPKPKAADWPPRLSLLSQFLRLLASRRCLGWSFLSIAFAVLSAPFGTAASLPAFSVIPAKELKDAQTPGRDYYLSKHRLRLDLTFKISAQYKLDEEAAPDEGKFNPNADVGLSEVSLTSVRERDQDHHYFMAFKQVSAFLRQKKFTMAFTEDGFLTGAEFSFDDQTLTILTELAKTAAIAMSPSTATDDKKQQTMRIKRATEALRLKHYIETLELQMWIAQSNFVYGINNKSASDDQVRQSSEMLEKLRTELLAAKSTRESLMVYGTKSDVMRITAYLDSVGTDGWLHETNSGSITKIIPLTWDATPAFSAFESKVQSAFGRLAPSVISTTTDQLPTAVKLTMEGDYKQPQPLMTFSKKVKPFKGIIYRRPRNVAGEVMREKETIHATDGATLKFGQLGEIIALPVKVKTFMKGELMIALNADGEILKLGSGASSALGASAVNTASSLLTTYQSIQKKEATGGFDTELLNAENAKLKAQIDNINNKNTLDDLQNPE